MRTRQIYGAEDTKAYRSARECRPAGHSGRQFCVGETFRHFNDDKRSWTSFTINSSSLSAAAMRLPTNQYVSLIASCSPTKSSLRCCCCCCCCIAALHYLNCVRTAQCWQHKRVDSFILSYCSCILTYTIIIIIVVVIIVTASNTWTITATWTVVGPRSCQDHSRCDGV